MEDRYLGDVGDFGKYGLLKALCLQSENSEGYNRSLGVVWYLVPDEAGSGDGKLTSYLKGAPENLGLYRSCDPDLYDLLREIVRGDQRNVAAIRQEQILPSGTVPAWPRKRKRNPPARPTSGWWNNCSMRKGLAQLRRIN